MAESKSATTNSVSSTGKTVSSEESLLACLRNGLQTDPLPKHPGVDKSVPHAPCRRPGLNTVERATAIRNALRYFPESVHAVLAPEFAQELKDWGHIYMLRFRPVDYVMRAYPVNAYPAKCQQAAVVMLMIMNNLDRRVAQYPHELVTYGGNGQVFANWAQYHLTMQYLSHMTTKQTLTMCSGHPQGLFPSHPDAPRVVITNGMVIPNYSSKAEYEKMFAMGVTMYGQMTAGSYCYIGPQGIVHGTAITVINAGRKYLGSADLGGVVYVTSGLGGMSGAQAKAAVIAGAVGVIAEIDKEALYKRHEQGWLQEIENDLPKLLLRIKRAKKEKTPVSIGYHGNIVDLWEFLATRQADEDELLVDLGSDQTSLHNPFQGGYYPAGLTYEESRELMVADPPVFKAKVYESLRRHVAAVNKLSEKGMKFWDYGNCFMLEASRAGADIRLASVSKDAGEMKDNSDATIFRYPSYVQDIMGDIFSLGFGPFRWVCCSGSHEDLKTTDKIATEVLIKLRKTAPPRVAAQLDDNIHWIRNAEKNKMVVGSEARILYADCVGRTEIALAMNTAIASGELKGPVAISRDHHDVSGTDSPFRETSNITDRSNFCADMAVQNFVGDSFRGASWIALHNGGGVGWGEVINGGFGLVLDGSADAARRAKSMLLWDVNNGVARRAWGQNTNAEFAIRRQMSAEPDLEVTLPSHADPGTVDKAIKAVF